MNQAPSQTKGMPHLTPATLVGRSFGRDAFNGIGVALVGYCPPPHILGTYRPQSTVDQYFIHVPPSSVQLCSHNGIPFLSIFHVYGGTVSSALIEELAYYGVEYVLAYGLAGGLGTRGLRLGALYVVEQALVADGTTPHYTNERLVASDTGLNHRIGELAATMRLPALHSVQALTGDAIYREYDEDLAQARGQGCDIVNCDSSHLFAVSKAVGIRSTECGVISDVAGSAGEDWQSVLAGMLTTGDEAPHMALVGSIVRLYVEALLPELVQG